MAGPAGTGEKKKSRFSVPASSAHSVPRQLSLNSGFVLPANGPRVPAAASVLPGPVPAATGCWAPGSQGARTMLGAGCDSPWSPRGS